jgi:hypothetical protein
VPAFAGSSHIALAENLASSLARILSSRYSRLYAANNQGEGFDSNNHSSSATNPSKMYYALHVRRGDFQFKDVKISAADIVKNLGKNGQPLIPRGAIV